MIAAVSEPVFRTLLPGDPAPWFKQRATSNPNFVFDTVAGRYIVLCFFGTAEDSICGAAIAAGEANRELFDDEKTSFFGVSIDPRDEEKGRVRAMLPGLRYFWDFDRSVCRLYGAVPDLASPGDRLPLRRFWMVVDPMLRVRAVFPFKPDGTDGRELADYVRALPPVEHFVGFEIPAPVLIIPNVFEPELCRHLVAVYEQQGGVESGFMREVNGKTVSVQDPSFKKRKDYHVEDPELIRHLQGRIIRRSTTSSPATPRSMARTSALTGTTPQRALPIGALPYQSTSTTISTAENCPSPNTAIGPIRHLLAQP